MNRWLKGPVFIDCEKILMKRRRCRIEKVLKRRSSYGLPPKEETTLLDR